MEEFEPKRKSKILTKEFIGKYAYIFVLAILLVGGISYGYTFFTENRKIASGSITTANLTINFTDRSISATSLSVPTTDQEGLSEFSKSLTITNQTAIDGRVKLSLTRTSGLALTDMRYAIVVNGAIQEIDDVPSDGEILSSAIMGNDTLNVEVRLWPKTTYSGSETTFVGEITPEIKYLGNTAARTSDLTGKYVNFNGNEVWQIVKVEDGRLVLTRQTDYTNATSRTNSNRYNPSLTFNDNSLITSVSTDNLNVYLAKTTKITGGEGSQSNPYNLSNDIFNEEDKKVIAVITYKDDTTTVGTQNIYYNETNYISQTINNPNFVNWTDGTNDYLLGDTVTFTSDINLNAVIRLTIYNEIISKASSVNYIANYNDIIQANPTYTTQDQVSTSATKQPVYYYTGSSASANANVLFAGYCWQIVRTTDNGGIRLLYNGVAVNNQCETTRTATKGLIGANATMTKVSTVTLYGRSYDYNIATGEFTLENTTGLPTWSTSDNNGNGTVDYKELIGTYTCLSDSATCTTLYYVGSVVETNYNYAMCTKYTIGNAARYGVLGKTNYNPNYYSPTLLGYMFNEEYNSKNGTKSEEHFSTATWNGTTYVLTNGNSGSAPDDTHRYICDTTCSKIRYYYYIDDIDNVYYFIYLENGKTVFDALKTMLNHKTNLNDPDENINVYNSAVKGYLDNWYKKNLISYTSYLDSNTVYCNNRKIKDYGGWDPNGTTITGTAAALTFYQSSGTNDLNCQNETDRFSISNNKAKLTYPVGLLTEPERSLMGANYASNVTTAIGSPNKFEKNMAYILTMGSSGNSTSLAINGVASSLRSVVTLAPGVELSGGTGSYTDPYVVGPIVTREN
jgi:hypothetical protein